MYFVHLIFFFRRNLFDFLVVLIVDIDLKNKPNADYKDNFICVLWYIIKVTKEFIKANGKIN